MAKIHEFEEEMTSFISPSKNILINKLENISPENSNTPENDSLCTRFIRKKFFCIMTFLIAIITVMQVINTITENLSGDNINSIFGHALKYYEKFMNKSTILKTNSSAIE